MRWVIAMATLCCLVFGEKSQVLETEDLVLEKGNQVLEILDFEEGDSIFCSNL